MYSFDEEEYVESMEVSHEVLCLGTVTLGE